MLSAIDNQLVTQIEEDAPCGILMRQYWQPVALKEELTDQRPVKAVKLMGEELVLFRDDNGDYGLIDRRCPHRGADLNFGRLENAGIRCPFHGWLFNIEGNCLEQPAEPSGSKFYRKIKRNNQKQSESISSNRIEMKKDILASVKRMQSIRAKKKVYRS